MESRDEEYHSEFDSIDWLGSGVYHALSLCPIGRGIPAEVRQSGRGWGLDLCPACAARIETSLHLGPTEGGS
jgi:hypothetical protein